MKIAKSIEVVNRVLETFRPNMRVVVIVMDGTSKVFGLVEANFPKSRFQWRAKEWQWVAGRPQIILSLVGNGRHIADLRTVDDYLVLPAFAGNSGWAI